MFNLDSALGIEVQADRLIMASVEKGFQDYQLKSWLILDRFRELPRPDLLARVQQFRNANGFNAENIVVGVPRDWVVIREVDFPIEVEENLDGVVRAQVEKLEPLEDVTSAYDFRVLTRDEETKRIVLQIVMVRRDVIDELLDLFKEMELYPASISFSSMGLRGVLAAHEDGLPRNAGVLVLRLDSGRVELLACSRNQQICSDILEIPAGEPSAEAILEQVAEELNPRSEEFQSFNKLYLTGEMSAELLGPFKDKVADAELLTTRLGLKHKGVDKETLGILVPAVGLAASGLLRKGGRYNLIPTERRIVNTRASLIPTYVLAVALLVLVAGLGTRSYFQQSALAAQVDSQVQGLQGEVNQVFALREAVEAKKAEVLTLQKLLNGRQKTLAVLKDLTVRIPDDAYLTSLQIQGEQLTMQGYANQASSLLPVIAESPFLESVKTNWITKDPRRANMERFNFEAKVK
ncbi:MAG: PilN domain-containing protein [Acidobacteriota bacterium]